jgi:hypothetical protein
MPTVKFDISQSEEIARHLQMSIEDVGKRALLATANRVVQHITTVIIPAINPQPVDRGAYRAGWRAKRIPEGAEVINTVLHALFIEDGVRGENVKIGKKMIDALAAWVRRKGIGGTVSKTGKVRKPSEDTARAIAWAIAVSMKKKGIFKGGEGFKVLARALKIVENAFAQELKTEIEREYR